jgi:hypothetical protein
MYFISQFYGGYSETPFHFKISPKYGIIEEYNSLFTTFQAIAIVSFNE